MGTIVCIYALIDPRTDEVRYVGKTVNLQERMWNHCAPKRLARSKAWKDRWIAQLIAVGLHPRVLVLEEADPDDWEAVEQRWIRYYRESGARLTNVTDGGEGLHGLKRGPMPEAQRELLRQAKLGRKLSPETREKCARALIGRKWTDQQRAKFMASAVGHPVSAETRERIAAAHRKLSEEDSGEILRRLGKGENQRSLAEDFGVSQATISNLVRGKYRPCAG
jgi:DNA-directed RNA polymerase specialized sigma24 family protein